MDAFVTRKRKRDERVVKPAVATTRVEPEKEEESTDFKLAVLASLHADVDEAALLEALLMADGSVEQASEYLTQSSRSPARKRPAPTTVGYQSSLTSYRIAPLDGTQTKKFVVKKGKTLFLYSPEDIETHTPCSIIHNFLPAKQADALLLELLEESSTYQRFEFKLFDRVVQSPHTYAFYVNSLEEVEQQKTEYIYDGRQIDNVRQSPPSLLAALPAVQTAVNTEIRRRITTYYPNAQKLPHQSPHPWHPNTAFVNCYDGPHQSVGYHTDQLTYLGPRPVIGSLSLGVAREFRVRRVVPQDDDEVDGVEKADAQGQISIHLPHNSLLVMHAEMQEEWKHSIAPAHTIDPHPLAGNKRINVTYRWYKESLYPKFTPRCRCGVPTVLRCAMRRKESRGRYMWMCHAGFVPGKEGCGFFMWAEFDGDGEPPWATAGKVREEEKGG
ncbi:hypothetical protein COCCADRAFT_4894 [Bipolaris zeicola 26-R-13]|uniref:Uncharacterized protein n=1 Tax=Cochliobolus carbonum (strain 26-R-13) TaxID=930089 RepID=W6YDI0_COCC2|nr:uncharacterized protein COCCADRAFT_4894 [Bipolaris zeicola 26-R-13]EUC33594.1 hypothetical protein COCCADRAFT_4894 [Bipolaris zeicola 26-R-13]